jgi:predicted DNA-binding transcriptional regulator AlpA
VYGVHVDTRQIRQSLLRALGDGGTFDMVDGVMAYLSPLIDDDVYLLERSDAPDPGQLELVGLAEVSAMTGQSKATIGHWLAGRRKSVPEFPAPRWTLECGPIWVKLEVETWCKLVTVP